MLLTEWARAVGLPIAGSRVMLDQVLRFVFGEQYLIQMRDGRSYQDNDLEVVLDIMVTEFHTHNTTITLKTGNPPGKHGFYPVVELLTVGSAANLFGQRGKLSLVVSVTEGWNIQHQGPEPVIQDVAAQVRQAITLYNLSGEWHSSFKKDNL